MKLKTLLYGILKRPLIELISTREAKLKVHAELANKDKNHNEDYTLDNVKLYYWKLSQNSENLGDYLSKVVVAHFRNKNHNSITYSKSHKENRSIASKTYNHTLCAIGSILGFRCQDSVVWGSGILYPNKLYFQRIRHSNLDIRAVRGPKTRKLLLKAGKKCPKIYGDPAILMPEIFHPIGVKKIFDVSLILHHSNSTFSCPENINQINIITKDYKNFITKILQSSLVISSSLHGVILSESYGVPAILLLDKNRATFKYEDWYHSTGRYNIVVAHSIEEALKLEPMPLPNLTIMQEQLSAAFPHDLWE